MCAADPTIATAYTLTQAFAMMVRERQGEKLSVWIAAAEESDIAEMRRFARGLLTDLAAVRGTDAHVE